MKNLFLTIILIVLFAGCNNSNTGNKQSNSSELKDSVFVYNDRFMKIESITKDDYEKYPECDYKKDYDDSNIIKSHNDTLKFVIDSINSVIFTDTMLNEESAEIRINKHIGNVLDYYIIETSFYETGGWTIVNKTNGLKYDLVSDPYLSPTKKFIFSFGGSMEYFVPPVIQLWIVKPDRLIKKIEKDTSNPGFAIEEIRWINDGKLAVKIGFGTGQQAYGIMIIK